MFQELKEKEEELEFLVEMIFQKLHTMVNNMLP